MRLTSPVVLIVLAVVVAATVMAVDRFSLQPHIQALTTDAIHTAGLQLQDTTREELREELVHLAQRGHLAAANINDQANRFAELEDCVLLIVTNAEGQMVTQYINPVYAQSALGRYAADAPEALSRALVAITARQAMFGDDQFDTGDLAVINNDVIMFSRHRLDSGQILWVMTPMDAVLEATGTLLLENVLPPSEMHIPLELGATLSRITENRYLISWPIVARDNTPLGFFRQPLVVNDIILQQRANRRVVLIALTVSIGMACLVLLAVYIAISLPLYRLIHRLRHTELGEGSGEALMENLHGEPREIAEKLAEAFHRLATISRTDALTALANRRHFENVLDAVFQQAIRYGRPLAMIGIDVDYFKAVNDTAGHQAGDALLLLVANAIRHACRQADLPARVGGDEFAILLPETSAQAAQAVAERIRQDLAKEKVIAESDMKITLSIGIADINNANIDTPEALQSLVDRALYASKERGRDCVVLANEIDDIAPTQSDERQALELFKKRLSQDSRFKELFEGVIDEIVVILETRSPHMADHARKVQHYATLVGKELGLSDGLMHRIRLAAMMHDIGMMAMPDSVLNSSHKLSDADLELVHQHPMISAEIMDGMELLGQEIPAVKYHHEHFDGTGYPEGLAGEAIPLAARILAAADAFDAMTSSRAFRGAMSVDEALAELKKGSGKQFDPSIVECFEALGKKYGDDLLEVIPRKRPNGR
jgi:diguanylate cyclase (GGDEF)-like protein